MTEQVHKATGPQAERTTLHLCGESVIADPAGALVWPKGGLLVVSDLHLEKGSWFGARGVHLPPYDSRTTLGRLNGLMDRYRPRDVIALGDSFHDQAAADRLGPEDRVMIRTLTERCAWTWITGNHDPRPPSDLGGDIADLIKRGPFTFRHEPRGGPQAGEVAGHLHPCAIVRVRGKRLRRRCFVTDGTRLVMPAFGAYTGGLDVLDPAFTPLFEGAFRAWLIGKDKVFPVASTKLSPQGETGERLMRLGELG